jgi:hypothetical protein
MNSFTILQHTPTGNTNISVIQINQRIVQTIKYNLQTEKNTLYGFKKMNRVGLLSYPVKIVSISFEVIRIQSVLYMPCLQTSIGLVAHREQRLPQSLQAPWLQIQFLLNL